jgi:hypothetical protein
MIGHDVLDTAGRQGRANHDFEAHPRFLGNLTLPGYSVFLHSCTFSIRQHNIMFSVIYVSFAEVSFSAVLSYSVIH